jgi:hypothetical protein
MKFTVRQMALVASFLTLGAGCSSQLAQRQVEKVAPKATCSTDLDCAKQEARRLTAANPPVAEDDVYVVWVCDGLIDEVAPLWAEHPGCQAVRS